jgi:predicted Zn-dependent protease
MALRLCAVFLLALAIRGQVRVVGRDFSREKEAALGAGIAADIRETKTPIESAIVQQYIERIGRRLSAQLPDFPHPFTFGVIAPDNISYREAMAIPGGYVFIPAHLILAARDEMEIAKIMAHAMAHLSERHFMMRVANTASIPLIFMGGWMGYGGYAVPRGLQSEHQRWEAEADAIAVKVTTAAGFDASSADLAPVQDELRRLTMPRPKRPPSLLRPNQ